MWMLGYEPGLRSTSTSQTRSLESMPSALPTSSTCWSPRVYLNDRRSCDRLRCTACSSASTSGDHPVVHAPRRHSSTRCWIWSPPPDEVPPGCVPSGPASRLGRAGFGRTDRRGECHPMVLGPGRSQSCPRAAEHLIGPGTENAGRLGLYCLGVVEMNVPAAGSGTFSQDLAVHDRVGAALIRCAALHDDVVGEVERPGPQRYRAPPIDVSGASP